MMLQNDEEFKINLEYFKTKLSLQENKTKAFSAIGATIDDIYGIVYQKKQMPFLQEGYSYIRGFTDEYQEAVDYFETFEGKQLLEVLVYFGYTFKVPESQKTGYNLDPNFNPDNIK